MINAVIMWPEKWLSEPSDPVHSFEFGTKELDSLIADLLETHLALGGFGLAAPQIGVHKQVLVMQAKGNPARVMINPTLVGASDECTVCVEGCFSMPTAQAPIPRHVWVDIKSFNEKGVETAERLEGQDAAVFEHEWDHLEGVLICDYAGPVKRSIMFNQVRKASKKLAKMESMNKAVVLSAKASMAVSQTKSSDEDYTVVKP